MSTIESFQDVLLESLVDRFEKDIRYGCHSTQAEASRSLAGKELQERAGIQGREVVPLISSRWNAMRSQSLSGVEERVRDGLEMLLTWIQVEK